MGENKFQEANGPVHLWKTAFEDLGVRYVITILKTWGLSVLLLLLFPFCS